jgi:hypothetical protein
LSPTSQPDISVDRRVTSPRLGKVAVEATVL